MTRRFYQLILWMHPPAFRRRFRDEMLSIFDEEGPHQSGFALLLDGFVSLGRQWLLRTDSWKVPIAIGGGFLQVWGFGYRFGYRIEGYQSWTANHEPLLPYMQGLIVITAGVICCLIGAIVLLAVWTARFQRRRSARR